MFHIPFFIWRNFIPNVLIFSTFSPQLIYFPISSSWNVSVLFSKMTCSLSKMTMTTTMKKTQIFVASWIEYWSFEAHVIYGWLIPTALPLCDLIPRKIEIHDRHYHPEIVQSYCLVPSPPSHRGGCPLWQYSSDAAPWERHCRAFRGSMPWKKKTILPNPQRRPLFVPVRPLPSLLDSSVRRHRFFFGPIRRMLPLPQ